jgi:hypothetical protein
MVPGAGLEPARPYERGILNPLCLPISPPGQRGDLYKYKLVLIRIFGGGTRSRTEIHGFAIRCIANLPFRHSAKYLITNFYLKKLERETRFELATPTLARLCSTTELFPLSLLCNPYTFFLQSLYLL